jgi:hypothetical protein
VVERQVVVGRQIVVRQVVVRQVVGQVVGSEIEHALSLSVQALGKVFDSFFSFIDSRIHSFIHSFIQALGKGVEAEDVEICTDEYIASAGLNDCGNRTSQLLAAAWISWEDAMLVYFPAFEQARVPTACVRACVRACAHCACPLRAGRALVRAHRVREGR